MQVAVLPCFPVPLSPGHEKAAHGMGERANPSSGRGHRHKQGPEICCLESLDQCCPKCPRAAGEGGARRGARLRLTNLDETHGWLPFIVKSRQLTDIQPCLNKNANMTLVTVPGRESRSVTHRDWRTLLRNSANNMLTRPPYDVPRANFADNPVGFRRLAICVLASGR
jgi:hypothetical protein